MAGEFDLLVSPHTKCLKLRKRIGYLSSSDYSSCGSRGNNNLGGYLSCEVKKGGGGRCIGELEAHTACYKSVMGCGTHGGKGDCGDEVRAGAKRQQKYYIAFLHS